MRTELLREKGAKTEQKKNPLAGSPLNSSPNRSVRRQMKEKKQNRLINKLQNAINAENSTERGKPSDDTTKKTVEVLASN